MASSAEIQITDHDIAIFRFIWRWKLATTSTLCARYTRHFKATPHTLYKRLKRLEVAGFLDVVRVFAPKPGHAWTLTEKSYASFKSFLPEIIQVGYKSENPTHDLFVQAAHLGNFLDVKSLPSKLRIITEQELRRVHPQCLPKELSESTNHRADGYWIYDQSKTTRTILALEVELSQKSSERYRECIFHYSLARDIDSVLWIVESEHLAKIISKELSADRHSAQSKHQFVLLADLVKQGWNSQIISGNNTGRKLSAFMNTLFGDNVGRIGGECWEKNPIHHILDTRLYPALTNTYATNPEEARRD